MWSNSFCRRASERTSRLLERRLLRASSKFCLAWSCLPAWNWVRPSWYFFSALSTSKVTGSEIGASDAAGSGREDCSPFCAGSDAACCCSDPGFLASWAVVAGSLVEGCRAGGLAGGFTATGFCAEWQAHTPSKAPTSSAVRTWRSTNRMFLNKMRGLSVELMFAEFYQKS